VTDARTWKVGDPCDAFVSGMWRRAVVCSAEPGPLRAGLGYVARVADTLGDGFTWSAWVARDELCAVNAGAPCGSEQTAAALGRWMLEQGVSIARMAERLGCSRSRVRQLRSGASMPSLGLAARIERITGGAVPAIGWVAMEAPDAG
jgi:hypothetical protein